MTTDIQLRSPRIDECAALSELCLRSKAHWGYDAAFMENCRDELAVTADTMSVGFSVVATINGAPAGYCELTPEGRELSVEKLFVDPEHIGQGIGRLLFDSMLEHAAASSAERIVIDSDPEAEGFYVVMGAQKVGEIQSLSIADRTLPQLEIRLPFERSE